MSLGNFYQDKALEIPEQKREYDMGMKGIYNFIDPADELYLE